MAHWLMEVMAGLFSLWAPDGYEDDYFMRDPLASQ
jgi:hypothetical protein